LELLTDRLKKALEQTLPGADAQYEMAPFHRSRLELEDIQPGTYRPSAVMIVFCQDKNARLFLPLTERPAYKGAHSAQISLPGGKLDPSDIDLEATAIRECEEEIGLTNIQVIGKLTPLYIPVSAFLVHPFVGVYPDPEPQLIHHEREVKTILRLYVDDLMNGNIMGEGTVEVMDNLKIRTPWYTVEQHKVWGATAMVLSELKAVLKTIA
jgi:8-oxo-dGTP pyrophosphatase MutT (NUDIX family)